MSDNGANTTTSTTYSDYSDYYYGTEGASYAPCSFDDLTAISHVFLPTLYSLVFILGCIGNGLVVCVLIKHRNQTNMTDICLFNLALSDLFFVLTLPLYSHYARVGEWPFGEFMCRFAAVIHQTGFFSSIFFMVVMTLDRYAVIMHALRVARYRTLRAGIALTVLVWIMSLSVSLPAFIFSEVTNKSNGLICEYRPENNNWRFYNIFVTNILGLVIPLLVMVACYSRIIPRLVHMRTAKKHRVVKLIISIVAAFFVFWAPFNICLFMRFLKYMDKLEGDECILEKNLWVTTTVTEAFAYTHCCLNPIIYAFVGQKFMKRALQMLKNCVPGIELPFAQDLSVSSYRKSSLMSRSSDGTSTFIK